MSAMPAEAALAARPLPPVRGASPIGFVRDTWIITGRHLLRTRRMPQIVVLSAVLPVMFVLLFRYVFGGSIRVPGYASYVDYLIPGVLVQTVLFGASSTTVGLADDLSKGIVDRLRSLPTHRGAILAARTIADLLRLSYTMLLLIGVGLLVGFRMHTDAPHVLAGLGVALAFGYACSWGFALLALGVRQPETATIASFVVVFPFVFAASTFTSTATMPAWLRTFADNQPVSQVAGALRALMEGHGAAGPPAVHALIWSAGILVVAATAATWRFKKI